MIENERLKSTYNYARDTGYADGFIDGYKQGLKDTEPKTGKWINKTVRGENVPCCSVCGLDTGTLYKYNYCPNCGVQMEVEE